MFCKACGAALSAGALFCEVCGVKIYFAASAAAIAVTTTLPARAPTQTTQLPSDTNRPVNFGQSAAEARKTPNASRGRILRDTNNGIGLISLGGRQMPFTLETNWRGEIAPVVQMTVDVVLDDAGNVVSVAPVSDKEVAQEKLKEMSGNLSRQLQDQIPIVKVYASMIGTPTLISVGLLFISWVWLSMATARVSAGLSQSATMFDLLRLLNTGVSLESFGSGFSGSSGIYGFACVVVMLAPMTPAFIRHRYISLTYFAPLLFLLLFALASYVKMRSLADDARQSLGGLVSSAQMTSMANAMMDQVLAAVSIGTGAYLSMAVAVYLSVHGGVKFLANR